MQERVLDRSISMPSFAFLSRLKGGQMPLPAAPAFKSVVLAWVGGVIAISILALLAEDKSIPLILGSFGATCVLVFGYPDVPFSQPRNVVLGHFLSSLVGLIFLTICGPHWWAAGLATGTAIAVMMLTRTVHPPAGSNPVIIFMTHPAWSFLIWPTLLGALAMAAIAIIYNNIARRTYPKYW